MQKKIIALAVAGLSTAAFAQTNVTIYGVADVSAQGTNIAQGNAALSKAQGGPQGSVFGLKSNSSLIGFKGTEDLGNGLKGLFQMETNVNLNGNNKDASSSGSGAQANPSTAGLFNSMRDSYVGLNSKYGTVLGGYLSTPYRSTLTSFDVMPGATGDGRNENLIGKTILSSAAVAGAPSSTATPSANTYASSVRSTAIAYAMPTLYGFNGSIAYTGNSANNNTTNAGFNGALSLGLGWSGYGVDVKGAFQQEKFTAGAPGNNAGNYTSYLIGAAYTGIAGLKLSALYNRNTIAINQNAAFNSSGSANNAKGSNNQLWVGASYRFGNNEPRLSWASTSNTSGLSGVGYGGQDGARQWTADWGYYLSKRTQVYGIVSYVGNNANGVYNMASATGATLTGGQKVTTYGAGLRTNF